MHVSNDCMANKSTYGVVILSTDINRFAISATQRTAIANGVSAISMLRVQLDDSSTG